MNLRRVLAYFPGVLLPLVLLVLPFLSSPYLLALNSRATIFACAAVSLQFVVGYAGLYSFGHAAFLGIGAYTLLALGGDAAVSLPVAMSAAGLFALLTGWFALATSGVTFIMITLAFGQMAYFVAQSLSVFGGDDGMALEKVPTLFGSPWLADPWNWNMFVYGLMAYLFVFVLSRIDRSRFGRALQATRENPARAAASGFDVRTTRLIAYVISGAATGAAGWMLAVQSAYVSPAMFDWRNSGELLVMVILGGVKDCMCVGLAAVLLVLAQEGLANYTEHWRLILGPILVLIVLRKAAVAVHA